MTSTSETVEQWASFALKSIQHDLDVPTTERVSRTDESNQSRRKLVELSQDLKKNTNEDVRIAIASLLKSFQIEIDSLSKRNNRTEKSFEKIEFSDPVVAIDYAQLLQTRIEEVYDRNRSDQNVSDSLDELADVKSQELTIKQLRDKIKDLEEKIEVIIQNHIKDKEDFQQIFVDKNHQLTLRTKYAQMEMRQSALDHIHQDMFEYKTKQEDATNTCSSNIDILNQDLEQAQERASNAERLVDKLREELEQTRTTNKNSDELISQEETERKLREKLELELISKEHQIATLAVETQKLQSTLIKLKETSFTQISDLENAVSGKEKLIAQLESKLQSQADYDEIKRELTILKSMELSTSTTRSNENRTENLPKKSLEILLLDKNRSLPGEPVQMKVSQTDSESITDHQHLQHSCRHCTSPCLHRINAPFLPIPSLLSSSASSSSNSSSSPSSPSHLYLKTHSQSSSTIYNGTDDMTRLFNDSSSKFLPPPPSSSLAVIATNPKYSSIASACSTMVTPTASLLSSVTTTTSLTPSNLFPGQQLSSVQCTKLHCPPTSSRSPPLSTSSVVANIATTSTDNRTVIKSSKQTSPSPTILVPSTVTTNNTITTTTTTATAATTSSSNNNNSILEPLDTTYVANVVRKLLAQHNIGQRIFARYILSLSQGTVSELLSKPKCWAKLTEKGKESYRKMWCWANSEESILTLKSISPRKGMNNRSKDNPYPAVSTKHTDPATHQKIVQILADAQKQQIAAAVAAAAAANMDQKPSLSPCSSLPNDPSNSLESKTPSSSSASSTVNSPMNESTPSDQQSFLLPLPPQLPPSSLSSTPPPVSILSSFVPSLLMRTANGFSNESSPSAGNLIDCSISSPFSLLCHQPDNYRNWLMLQEIVRNNDLLKQFQPALPPLLEPPPLSSSMDTDDESEQENGDDDDDQTTDTDDDDDDDRNDNDMNEENPTGFEEIPLDLSMKMDSNHYDIEQTSIRPSNNKQQSSSSSTKHVKTALTPLREQDTSKYRYVNTMELVQTVKDILSRYSISQRHFGEKILGLSQGSVSDILARPKQWELLTQKGREPFLRMRIFLDDPNAIKQLVLTVSTTTTTNPNSILIPTFCPPLPPPPPPPPSLSSSIPLSSTPSLLANVTLNGFHSNNLLTRDNSVDSQSNYDSSQLLPNDSIQLSATSSSSPSNGLTSNSNKSKSRSKNTKTTNDKPPSNQSRHSSTNPLMTPYELPKITLPSSIDTEQLSSQVRELLFAYSIGQRVFGEAVLNLSQGTVSEILSKPRPWHSLSVKGREPYIRMYTWFNDVGNVQKLLAWKRERDALRRSRPPATAPATTTTTTTILTDNGDSESGNHNSSTTLNRSKRRCLFTDDQRRVLKQIFENEPYPSQATLEQLVGELSLPMNKIANWFHNSRMRAKTNIRPLSSSPTNKYSTTSFNPDDLIPTQSDDEDDLDDNNNNHTNTNDDDDDDDEDNYSILPTIVPLTSSWLNGTNDSNSSTSPISFSTASTNIVSLIDDQKLPSLPASSSSSSKKRKSVPQKIVTNNNNTMAKKFHSNSTIIEHESNGETNQTTNESANFVDILT